MKHKEAISSADQIRIYLGAIQAAILFYPAFLLCNYISWVTDHSWIAPMLISVCYGFSFWRKKPLYALFQWLCSLPLTLLFWYFFAQMQFYIRALNLAFPDYGNPSAGGNFATCILLLFFSFFCLLTGIAGACCSLIPLSARLRRIGFLLQQILCWGVCLAISAALLYIDTHAPAYATVQSYIMG